MKTPKQLLFVTGRYWSKILNWLYLKTKGRSVYSILLNISFEIKVWHYSFRLLICVNSMLYYAKNSIFWRYLNNFFQDLVILRHGLITTVFKRSFTENLWCKFWIYLIECQNNIKICYTDQSFLSGGILL